MGTPMSPGPKVPAPEPEPPTAFRIARDLPLGRHSLLTVFPGLDRLPPGRKIHADAKVRSTLFTTTEIELVGEDMWMYVAPRELPKVTRGRWEPVVSPETNCIVVGASHLRESPALTLYLDIYHELCHILQRDGGAELWEPGVSYVERWTEVEAYRFVVVEARRLKVSDVYLRDYLSVEWITAADHRKLLRTLGVSVR
jgi:hypothetical protein